MRWKMKMDLISCSIYFSELFLRKFTNLLCRSLEHASKDQNRMSHSKRSRGITRWELKWTRARARACVSRESCSARAGRSASREFFVPEIFRRRRGTSRRRLRWNSLRPGDRARLNIGRPNTLTRSPNISCPGFFVRAERNALPAIDSKQSFSCCGWQPSRDIVNEINSTINVATRKEFAEGSKTLLDIERK